MPSLILMKRCPFSGKTVTLAALIRLLNEIGKSVLITSHTHSAVDNLCLKLVGSGIKFMRLGAKSRIHPELKEYSEHNLTKQCQTPTELEKVYNNMVSILSSYMFLYENIKIKFQFHFVTATK